MWFLQREAILTIENLTKINWQVIFFDKYETIQCHFAKVIWRIIHMSFNITPPKSITNLFGNCLDGIHKKVKSQIYVCKCTLPLCLFCVIDDNSYELMFPLSFCLKEYSIDFS
jgi:hypothetical protein